MVAEFVLLLGCRWNTFWMSDSINEEDAVAQTTSTFQRLLHRNSDTRIVDFVCVNLQQNRHYLLTTAEYRNAVQNGVQLQSVSWQGPSLFLHIFYVIVCIQFKRC